MNYILTEDRAWNILDSICNYAISPFYKYHVPFESIDIMIEDMDTEAGYCIPNDEFHCIEMGLIPDVDSYETAVNLISHEYVHAIQIYHQLEVGHHTSFWRSMKRMAYVHRIYI